MNKEAEGDKRYQQAKELLRDKGKLLDSVMAAMGDGLSIQDLNMRIVFQNDFMISNFGDHRGDFCYRIYEQRDTLCEGCPIQEAYKDGKVHNALRVGIIQDGTRFRFENIASVLKNKDDEIIAGMELCRIVEDREQAKEKLQRSQDELKEKVVYLEHLNRIMTDRELRMIELKQEVNDLLKELGQPTKYPKLKL